MLYTLSIPAGYELSYLPKDTSFQHKAFNYTSHYKLENNKIIFTQRLSFHKLIINPAEFEAYNELVAITKSSQNEALILKKQ